MRFLKYIFSFLLFSNFLIAQNYVVEKYGNENNLDTNEILKIHIDKRENIWIATRFGILIKDMNKFLVVKRFNELKFNNVLDIKDDQNDDLWFASYGLGILYFDGQKGHRFTSKNGLVSDRFRKLFLYKDKIYAAGVNGLSVIDVETKKINSYTVKVPKNEVFECSSFFEINGKLYVTSISHGVYEVTNSGLKLINPFKRILAAYTFNDQLFLSANNGVAQFQQKEFLAGNKTYRHSKLPIIWSLDYINNDKYWMASYDLISGIGGILEFDDKTKKNEDITSRLNISASKPNDIVFDKLNDIAYISTLDNGLYRVLLDMPIQFKPIPDEIVVDITSYKGKDYLISKNNLFVNDHSKSSILVNKDEFWEFFHAHKYKFKINSENEKHFFEIDFNQPKEAFTLERILIQNNFIGVGTNVGLFQISLSGELLAYYPIHTFNFTFIKNQLIESHPFGGVKIFTDLKKMKYKYYTEIYNDVPTNVVSITNNSNAVFFGSSLDGVYKYENGNFISYFKKGIFKETKIKHVKAIGENELLVASEFGDVYLFETKKDQLILKRKIEGNSLKSSNISFINKYENKIIIGSFLGLTIVDGDKVYFFDDAQGIKYKSVTSSELNGKDILIGVNDGYYTVDINKIISQKSKKPTVLITGIKVNDFPFGREKFMWFDLIDKNLNLPYAENNISIDFTIQNPKFPSKYKYRYRLNAKEEWSEYFEEEIIRFNSLKNGSYNIDLEITDLNTSSVYVHQTMKIRINPPFYLNPLFIIAQILLIGYILYLFYRIKIKSIHDINELKITQLEELNDAKNQRLLLEKKMTEVRLMALQSQMNPHFIFNILNTIQYYIINNDMTNALDSLSNFASLIRKILDVSTKKYIPLNEELDFLKLYISIENYRYKNKVEFEIQVEDNIDINSFQIPPMLLQPLVENTFVHAFIPNQTSNKLIIKIQQNDIFLEITVIDNGIGMENSQQKMKLHQSKGLEIIRERLNIFNEVDGEFLRFTSNEVGTKAMLLFKIKNLQQLKKNSP